MALTDKGQIKFLSIFIDRIIPDFFKQRYPNYKLFIKYFLEFLEEDGNVYEQISTYIDFIDIDAIDDETDLELREQLLDVVYEQFLGTSQARELSTLLDDVLYLKLQKSINSRKGTEFSFTFFLNLTLDGFFKFESLNPDLKLHNAFFPHNGLISYNGGSDFIEPYIYQITSEFQKETHEDIINLFNPAGMYPLFMLQQHKRIGINTGDDIIDIYEKPNVYAAFYNDQTGSEFVGMTKSFKLSPTTLLADSVTDFDLQLQDNSKWNIDTIPDGFLDYENGNDVNLTYPNAGLNQNDQFIPMESSYPFIGTWYKIDVYIGDYRWHTLGSSNHTGSGGSLISVTNGANYGQVLFKPQGANDWDTFASSSFDGLQRMWFPKLVVSDKLGGYIDFYYDYTAWFTAFNGTSSDCIISKDGSVFKDSISITNLVVRYDGVVGPAGGNSDYFDGNDLFYNIYLTEFYFTGDYNRVKILSNPLDTSTGTPIASEYFYDEIFDEGEVLYDVTLDDDYTIQDYVNVGIMVEFASVVVALGIGLAEIGTTLIIG